MQTAESGLTASAAMSLAAQLKADDLIACATAQDVALETGDVLLVRGCK